LPDPNRLLSAGLEIRGKPALLTAPDLDAAIRRCVHAVKAAGCVLVEPSNRQTQGALSGRHG
jgi:hypothetical protein